MPDFDFTEEQSLERARAHRIRDEAIRITGTGEACDRAERLANEANYILERNGGNYSPPEAPKRSTWDKDIRFGGWD